VDSTGRAAFLVSIRSGAVGVLNLLFGILHDPAAMEALAPSASGSVRFPALRGGGDPIELIIAENFVIPIRFALGAVG
jgi:hypothetical protein